MDSNQNRNNQNNNKNPKNKQILFVFVIATVVALLGISILSSMLGNYQAKKISYDKFLEMLEKDEVKEVEITSYQININGWRRPVFPLRERFPIPEIPF